MPWRWRRGNGSEVTRRRRTSPLPPPLHRVPLRAGNVVEIVGPSPSAKSQVLLEVAVNCILPKEWKGVSYGGLEQSLVFINLDCRFDILRLLQLLKSRISRAIGSSREGKEEMNTMRKEYNVMYDEDLIEVCLKRFRYIRCYDSFEFLATLKGLAVELQSARTKFCSSVSFLMIDSIGAYYWVDRASTSLPFGSSATVPENVTHPKHCMKSQWEVGQKTPCIENICLLFGRCCYFGAGLCS